MQRARMGRWLAGMAIVADRRHGLREGRPARRRRPRARPRRSARRAPALGRAPRPAASAGVAAGDLQGRRRQGHRQDDDQPVGRRRGQRRGRPVPAPADGLQGRDQHARRGGRLAGLRHRRGRRHPRELGPPRPREEVHHRQEARARTPARTASPGSSAGTSPAGWSTSIPTSPTGTTSTSTPTCSRRSESGDKGQFLGSDPTFVQYDEALIANLGLNYKVVFSGSEAATITAFQAGRQEQDAADRLLLRPAVAPERDQARPGQAAALHDGLRRRPEEGRLRLPAVHPEQDRPHGVARQTGGDAATFIKNFKWTQRRPERGRRLDHEQEDVRRGRRQGVDRRPPDRVAGLDARLLGQG